MTKEDILRIIEELESYKGITKEQDEKILEQINECQKAIDRIEGGVKNENKSSSSC